MRQNIWICCGAPFDYVEVANHHPSVPNPTDSILLVVTVGTPQEACSVYSSIDTDAPNRYLLTSFYP